jgi:hypothetical protein
MSRHPTTTSEAFMSDSTSPRFAELYWHYHAYYLDYLTSQGLAPDEAAADAYAREHAASTLATEAAAGESAATASDATVSQGEASELAAEPTSAIGAGATQASAPVAAPAGPTPVAAAFVPLPPNAAQQPSAPRRKLPAKALIIAGAAAALVVVLGMTAAFVVPALLGGSSAPTRLQDLREEPEAVWSYSAADDDYLGSPTFAALSGSRTLVVSAFDYDSWSSDQDSGGYYYLSWYAGIEDDYEAGFAAGQSYGAAYDAWWDAFDGAMPERSDYYPTEFGGVDPYDVDWGALDSIAHGGAFVGWDDARYGEHGDSLPPEPVTPEDTSSIAVVDGDGEQLWSVQLDDIMPEHDPASDFLVLPIEQGARHLVVYDVPAPGADEDAASRLAVLDASSGEVVDSLELDGSIVTALAMGTTLVVGVQEGDGDRVELRPIRVTDLDADAAWTQEVRDAGVYLYAFDASVFAVVDSSSETEYRKVSDGEETSWSGSADVIQQIGGRLIGFDTNSDDTRDVTAFSSDGKKQWSIDDVEQLLVVDDVLFVADDSGSDVTPLDLGNGQERWKKPIDDVIPVAVRGDRVLMQAYEDGEFERQLFWVSLSSGEKQDADAPKVPDVSIRLWGMQAQSMLYVTDDEENELLGFALDQRKSLWSFDLDDDESIRRIGDRLFVWDSDKRRLSLLGKG